MLDLKRTIRDILVNHWPRDPGTPVRHECTDEITAFIEANYISKAEVIKALDNKKNWSVGGDGLAFLDYSKFKAQLGLEK